ncbi:MAG: CBS domain-containing protein [Gammaproteobacteria bacterium]
MRSIKTLLEKKGGHVWSVAPKTSVFDAITLMAEKQIGAVVVLEDEKLVGIFSERDYARKIILKDRSSRNTLVEEIMTSKVICARQSQQVEECMAIMMNGKFRHMPVVEDRKVIGVVALGDLVKVVIAEQQFTIEQLESYISG